MGRRARPGPGGWLTEAARFARAHRSAGSGRPGRRRTGRRPADRNARARRAGRTRLLPRRQRTSRRRTSSSRSAADRGEPRRGRRRIALTRLGGPGCQSPCRRPPDSHRGQPRRSAVGLGRTPRVVPLARHADHRLVGARRDRRRPSREHARCRVGRQSSRPPCCCRAWQPPTRWRGPASSCRSRRGVRSCRSAVRPRPARTNRERQACARRQNATSSVPRHAGGRRLRPAAGRPADDRLWAHLTCQSACPSSCGRPRFPLGPGPRPCRAHQACRLVRRRSAPWLGCPGQCAATPCPRPSPAAAAAVADHAQRHAVRPRQAVTLWELLGGSGLGTNAAGPILAHMAACNGTGWATRLSDGVRAQSPGPEVDSDGPAQSWGDGPSRSLTRCG